MPKNVKGGRFGIFHIHCVANYRNKRRGGPLVESKKFGKCRTVPKTIRVKNNKGWSYVFEILDYDVVVFDEVLSFREHFGPWERTEENDKNSQKKYHSEPELNTQQTSAEVTNYLCKLSFIHNNIDAH